MSEKIWTCIGTLFITSYGKSWDIILLSFEIQYFADGGLGGGSCREKNHYFLPSYVNKIVLHFLRKSISYNRIDFSY